MKSITAPLRSHLDQEVTSLATCWRVARRDGKVFAFTDCDTNIKHEGETYVAMGAYSRTAIENTSSLAVDNLDVSGISNVLYLPADELRKGLFDYAEVSIFLISWASPETGTMRLRKGFLGEVQVLSNSTYKVEIRGLLQKLSHNYMHVYSETCRNDLGDKFCRKPVAPRIIYQGAAFEVNEYGRAYDSGITGSRTNLDIRDPRFEDLQAKGIDLARYWGPADNVGGEGPGFFQEVPLTGRDVTAGAIDAGYIYLNFRAIDLGDGVHSVTFLDGNNNKMGDGNRTDTPTNGDVLKRVDLPVPAGARSARLAVRNVDWLAGWLINTNKPGIVPMAFSRLHICTTSGVVGAPIPASFDTAPNNMFVKQAVVKSVQNNRVFDIEILEPDEKSILDGWFNGGLATFYSGDNNGMSMEIKSWRGSENRLALFLGMAAPVEAGDVIEVFPGCDKTRICCSVAFDNIKNFFGFPDVPGEGAMLDYGVN